VALTFAAPSADAAFPGQNGKIAFVTSASSVDTIDPDGTGLTSTGHQGFRPRWSADGKKIVYAIGHLHVMNADGSDDVDLNVPAPDVNGGQTYPAWSPDSTKIVFSHEYCPVNPDECQSYLYVMNSDGSGVTQLPCSLCLDYDPSWSPDGSWIAFWGLSEDTGQYGISKVRPDGTGRTEVFAGNGSASDPDWSPDGSKLMFKYSTTQLGIVNSDGSGFTTIDLAPGYPYWPTWSPDGRKIAFLELDASGTQGHVDVINSDGTGKTQLASAPYLGAPSWQPIPNRPPDCSGVAASRPVLTTANHRLVPITLDGATDPDGDPVTLTIDGVTQDEPVVSRTDNTSPDAVDQGDGQLRVRAERNPHGDGRVYRIAFTASDGKGGSCSGTATVSVARKQRKAAIDSAPPSYDSLVH
jgi:dipeptidyl aminopeptidase/acylaminoacyl peptidase